MKDTDKVGKAYIVVVGGGVAGAEQSSRMVLMTRGETHSAQSTPSQLHRSLGIGAATSVVVGGIIGSSIFFLPGLIAREVHSPLGLLLVWSLAALMAICGSVCFAELGSALPKTGGTYYFLKRAYHPFPAGFVFAWTWYFAYASAAIGATATGVGIFVSILLEIPKDTNTLVVRSIAILVIVGLTTINCLGVVLSGRVQFCLSALKVTALVVVASLCLIAIPPADSALGSVFFGDIASIGWGGVGTSLMLALFTFSGWHFATHIGGEVRDPGRNLPKATLFGVLIVIACYFLVIIGYMNALSIQQISDSDAVATTAIATLVGARAAGIIAVMAVISALGGLNAQLLNYPRIVFALAQDVPSLRSLASVNDRSKTPARAILLQGGMACLYASLGTFTDILTTVAFISHVFIAFAVGSVIVLRIREPHLERPYKAFLYPLTPIVYIIISVIYLALLGYYRFNLSLIGIMIAVAAIPAYILFNKHIVDDYPQRHDS